MDVAAIELLQDRAEAHRDIDVSIVKDASNIIQFKDEVTKATHDTTVCIKQVTEYVERIKGELVTVKTMVQKFNLNMGETMESLLQEISKQGSSIESSRAQSKMHVKEWKNIDDRGDRGDKRSEGSGGSVGNRGNHDLQNLLQQRELQKLAKQQQDLLKLMLDTENIISNVEREGHISLDDLDTLGQNLKTWRESIVISEVGNRKDHGKKQQDEEEKKRKQKEENKRRQIEDEKRRQMEEEKRKEMEEEKRKQIEEEKRKQQEEKQKQEERRRQEQERERRNPKNWPTYVYDKAPGEDNAYNEGILCIVSAMYGSLLKEDLICKISDDMTDIEEFREGRDEIILSSKITIESRSGTQIKTELPIRIFIPCDKDIPGRETILKMKVDGERLKVGQALKDSPNVSRKDINSISTEVDGFKRIDLVVVSRARRQNLFVTSDGGNFGLAQNNINIAVPPGTFPHGTNVSASTYGNDVGKTMKNNKNLNNIKLYTGPHVFQFDDENEKEIKVHLERDCSNRPGADQVIHIATNQNSKGWKMETSWNDDKDGVFISLPTKTRSTEILGLIVDKSMKSTDITRAADLISNLAHEVRVRLLCKQNSRNPEEIYLRCVPSDICQNVLDEMKAIGFSDGPPKSAEFGICDGECITIKSKGGVKLKTGQEPIVLRFYVNFDSASTNGNLFRKETSRKGNLKEYVGHILYNVGDEMQDPPRSGSLTVYLQKFEEVKLFSKKYKGYATNH